MSNNSLLQASKPHTPQRDPRLKFVERQRSRRRLRFELLEDRRLLAAEASVGFNELGWNWSATGSSATDISDNGEIVGCHVIGRFPPEASGGLAFFWSNDVLTDIDPTSGPFLDRWDACPSRMNEAGQSVGTVRINEGAYWGYQWLSAWNRDEYAEQILRPGYGIDINNQGIALGFIEDFDASGNAFVTWDVSNSSDTFSRLQHPPGFTPKFILDDSSIIGEYQGQSARLTSGGATFTLGEFEVIDWNRSGSLLTDQGIWNSVDGLQPWGLNAGVFEPVAMNENHAVIGYVDSSFENKRAYIWEDSERDLIDIEELAKVNGNGWKDIHVSEINTSGSIVGSGSFQGIYPFERIRAVGIQLGPDIASHEIKWDEETEQLLFTYFVSPIVDLPQATDISFYWATGPNYADRIDDNSIFTYDVSGTSAAAGFHRDLSIPKSALIDRPGYATHLVMVADVDNEIRELSETNNVASIEIATVSIVDVEWRSAEAGGGWEVIYEVKGVDFPFATGHEIDFFWATGPQPSEILPWAQAFSFSLAEENAIPGLHRQVIKRFYDSSDPGNYRYLTAINSSPPDDTSHLIAVSRSLDTPPFTDPPLELEPNLYKSLETTPLVFTIIVPGFSTAPLSQINVDDFLAPYQQLRSAFVDIVHSDSLIAGRLDGMIHLWDSYSGWIPAFISRTRMLYAEAKARHFVELADGLAGSQREEFLSLAETARAIRDVFSHQVAMRMADARQIALSAANSIFNNLIGQGGELHKYFYNDAEGNERILPVAPP